MRLVKAEIQTVCLNFHNDVLTLLSREIFSGCNKCHLTVRENQTWKDSLRINCPVNWKFFFHNTTHQSRENFKKKSKGKSQFLIYLDSLICNRLNRWKSIVSQSLIVLEVRHFYDIMMVINKFGSLPAFTCSKLTIETLGQGLKYVQS